MRKRKIINDPPTGVLFVDPNTLPDYKPAKKVYFQEALAYARKVWDEEHRDVTFEEMQQFTER